MTIISVTRSGQAVHVRPVTHDARSRGSGNVAVAMGLRRPRTFTHNEIFILGKIFFKPTMIIIMIIMMKYEIRF